MKLRRLLLAAIVFGGILLVVLGIAGVFSSDRLSSPTSPTESAQRPPRDIADNGDVESGQPVIEDFRVEGDGWVLTGTRAQMGAEGQVKLMDPELQGTRQTSEGTESVHVRANNGLYISSEQVDDKDVAVVEKIDRRVEMSGSVIVEFVGDQEAQLKTETIQILLDQGIVRSDERVSIRAMTPDGRQSVSGVGFEMMRDQRVARLFQDVHMEISGASSVIPGRAPSPEGSSVTTMTYIDSQGPVVLDGYKRSFVAKDEVTLKQGDTQLEADSVAVFFAAEGQTVDRVQATGNVRFEGPDISGYCKNLLHVADEEQVLLEGQPAALSHGPNAINSNRIEMDLTDGRVFVPVSGDVKFSMPAKGDSAATDVVVKWSNSMTYDDARGEAVCRGDVRFSYDNGSVEMRSNRLNVSFNKDTRELKQCRGVGDVRLEGQIESFAQGGVDDVSAGSEPVIATSREMVYDPVAKSLLLRGTVTLDQGLQSLSGEYVDVDARDGVVQVIGAGRLFMAASEPAAADALEATWTGEMRFARNTGAAEFERDVALQYGTAALVADHLVAQISEDNDLHNLDARGNVTLTEVGAAEDSERVLRADKLTVLPREGDASVQDIEATGRVVVTEIVPDSGALRTLHADKVMSEITSDRSMKHFDALGHVVFEQDGSQGRGDKLAWDIATETGILTGAPVILNRGRSELTGDRIEFDQKGGRVRITSDSRVNARIVTSGNNKNVLGDWFGSSLGED